MRIVTGQENRADAIGRWPSIYATYSANHTFPSGKSVGGIRSALSALDPATCSRAELDGAGLPGWAVHACDECGTETETLMRVGDDPNDYGDESRWQDLCADCLSEAVSKLHCEAVRAGPPPFRDDIRDRVQSFIDSVAITVWPTVEAIADELRWEPLALGKAAEGSDVAGYATTGIPGKPPRVDVWFSPDATVARKAFCVGHELGHMAIGSLPTGATEEMRADAFGIVAARVLAFMWER